MKKKELQAALAHKEEYDTAYTEGIQAARRTQFNDFDEDNPYRGANNGVSISEQGWDEGFNVERRTLVLMRLAQVGLNVAADLLTDRSPVAGAARLMRLAEILDDGDLLPYDLKGLLRELLGRIELETRP